MNILDFFKTLFGWVKKIVPREQLVAAVEYAKDAAVKFSTNEERRAYVIKMLTIRFNLPESVARLTVELAVQQIKRGANAGAKKIEEKL